MARRPRIVDPDVRNINIIRDPDGDEIDRSLYTEEMIEGPDDKLTNQKTAENKVLETGEVWNTTMLAGPKPVLAIGRCEACASAGRRGLAALSKLKHCHRCGISLCPKCRVQSAYDKKWRCLRHHWWHALRLRIRSIFMEPVDEG